MTREDQIREITIIAHEVEWTHAIDRCRINGRFHRCRGSNAKALRKQAIASEFDPHAATELAMMIESRLFPADG